MNYIQIRPITADRRFQYDKVRLASQGYIHIHDRFIPTYDLNADDKARLCKLLPEGVSANSVIGFLNTGALSKFKKGVLLLTDKLIFVDSRFKVKRSKPSNVLPFANLVSADSRALSLNTIELRYMKEYKQNAATRKVTLHCGTHKEDLCNFLKCLIFTVGKPEFEEEVEVVPVKTHRYKYCDMDLEVESPDIGRLNYYNIAVTHAPSYIHLADFFKAFSDGFNRFYTTPMDFPRSLSRVNYRENYRFFTFHDRHDWEDYTKTCTYYYATGLFYDGAILQHADVLLYVMHSSILRHPEELEHYRKCARRFSHPVVYLTDGHLFNEDQQRWFRDQLIGDDIFREPMVVFGDIRNLNGSRYEASGEARQIHNTVKKAIYQD